MNTVLDGGCDEQLPTTTRSLWHSTAN